MTDALHNRRGERRFGLALHVTGAVVVVAATAVIGIWGYQPLRAAHNLTRRSQDVTEQFLADSETVDAEARLVAQRFEQTRNNVAKSLQQVPAAALESEFLSQLSTLASESQLVIREFRPGGVTTRDEYHELEIRLSAEGSYPSLCRFLRGLQELPRLCKVRALRVSGSGSSVEGRYPIELTVVVFWAPLEIEPVPLAEAVDGTV